MKATRALTALAAAVVASASATHAAAYCLTRTCDPIKDQCQYDSTGICIISGKPLFWPNSCVSFDVQKDGSAKLGIDYDTVHQISVNAFQTWVDADCGQGTHPSIHIADYGKVDCSKPEYNQTQPNANVVTFRDKDWPYVNATDTLALTTVYFNGESGEIYDANTEINSHLWTFTQDGTPGGEYDLNGVLTHEFGHFLGLSHSAIPSATMYAMEMPGMETLDPDDVTAICLSLAPDRMIAGTDCTPRHGFSGECGHPESGCCATAIGGDTSRNESLGLFAFGLGLFAWTGRARFRRSARSVRSRK